MSLRLLPAGVAYAPVMAALHARCFVVPWTAGDFAGLCDMPGVKSLLALDRPRARKSQPRQAESLPVGFVMHRVAADEAEILTLGVLTAYRGRGIGRALVVASAKTAAAQGARTLFLEVAVANESARALYHHLGFACVGQRRDYYHPGAAASRDALTLRAALPLATVVPVKGKGTP